MDSQSDFQNAMGLGMAVRKTFTGAFQKASTPSQKVIGTIKNYVSAVPQTNKDTLDTVDGAELGTGINAKVKTGGAPIELSKLWYSLYGMDSYPGYLLARFSERRNHGTNLKWLEDELEAKLMQVRSARMAEGTRERLLQTYQPTMTLPAPRDFLPSALLDVAQNKLAIPQVLEEIEDQVYLFQLFTPEFCAQLLEQVEHFSQWREEVTVEGERGSEDLNNRLCVVDHMGDVGEKLLDVLRDEVVDPLAKQLFPEVASSDVGSHYRYGFILGYSNDVAKGNISRKALDAHTDDAEITLTVCLGQDYEGGEVTMKHIRSTPQEGEFQQSFKMKTGQASLFLGQQLHQVEEVTGGKRYIFVVWFRREKYRATHCPCCRMFRRERCVHGPEMN